MNSLGKLRFLAIVFGAMMFMQLLCGCGSDSDDGAQAIKNTLECKLFFKIPEKDAELITLFRGKEPVFPDVNKERQAVIDEISKCYFGNVSIDNKKKENLINKILNTSNAIKYEIIATGKKVKDSDIDFQEYIVRYEYPDFEKIYSEARTIVNQEKAKVESEQTRGDMSKINFEKSDQLLCEKLNVDLYSYYDKAFSDLEKLPMKKGEAKYYIANIKDNIYAQDPMGDRLLNLQDILDLSEVAPFLARENLHLMY